MWVGYRVHTPSTNNVTLIVTFRRVGVFPKVLMSGREEKSKSMASRDGRPPGSKAAKGSASAVGGRSRPASISVSICPSVDLDG